MGGKMDVFSGVFDKMAAGGLYMLPILLVSAIMFGLILLRAVRLRHALSALRGARAALRAGVRPAAPSRPPLRPQGPWLRELFGQYQSSRSGRPKLDAALAARLCAAAVNRLDAGGASILVCASLATLLGLLGTVSGMISSFESLSAFGAGNVKAMAGGISEALITTQSGLVVGVAGFLAGRVLLGFNGALLREAQAFFRDLEEGPAGGRA